MTTWTHCRACGVKLAKTADMIDGLHTDSTPRDCWSRFMAYFRACGFKWGRGSSNIEYPATFDHPVDSARVDAWLEQGQPTGAALAPPRP